MNSTGSEKKEENKIPADILNFLSKPGGRSLIIRGGPGTGGYSTK